jgi:hypothetical protein
MFGVVRLQDPMAHDNTGAAFGCMQQAIAGIGETLCLEHASLLKVHNLLVQNKLLNLSPQAGPLCDVPPSCRGTLPVRACLHVSACARWHVHTSGAVDTSGGCRRQAANSQQMPPPRQPHAGVS